MPTTAFQTFTAAILLISKQTGMQFFAFFGVLFISGLILTWISRWTGNSFQQFFYPRLGLYVFGIIGIPLHELSHAVFAKVFFHEIKKVKWFDPKGRGGSHGAVTHAYDEKNLYHRIGLFFIGMGPVLLTPVLILVAYYGLVPSAGHFSIQTNHPMALAEHFLRSFVAGQNWHSLKFYFFLYLTICVTSQMELSPEDFAVARGGIFPFLLLLLIVNLLAYAFGFDLHSKLILIFNSLYSLWAACFLMVAVVACLNFLFFAVVLNALNRIMGHGSINPFKS